ncbi:lipase [Amycolatopsis mediterranei S699]|uniref:Cutinase n=3 Tax=Amycolatopsis mediterranei TaxID=33910 RepID=PETH1_AMYMS|nr:lipase [Amycolatopsis mediterranei]P0DX29.1 RecName: Full=Cutinase; AltName: Full=AML; AltName: Full=AmCut; AltName: Full=Lipase; Flags: Precursor [Amycolatopsis mediterranei S699]UXP11781.1 cutinase [synthetic construct]ADJ49206.1 lipase [Amycolatopsis mediterranei U32]AEK46168.1 lipase [Amycolatopsis mediterranei S699]AFO80914.1 lipase [Amycolatopsis mediterranei S699]AGT88042.1 lipase [Amycolatopsis mediterranei RB]
MSALTSQPTSSGSSEKIPRLRGWRAKAAGVVLAALALTTGVAAPAPAAANPYERGPDPTTASIEATSGSFATSTVTVSRLAVSGFGGGTIYYPTTTTAGTFGALSIAPGFTATQSSIAWLGPRLASQGFVVFTIDTLTTSDQPDSRGRQLLASLDYLTQQSSVRSRIDSTRLGVVGHSMGGGGTLEAARSRPTLQAAVPLTAWDLTKNWSTLQVPTLVVGAQSDTVAPVASHSIPFYTSLPSTLDRAYLELRGASHFAPNSPNTTIAKYTLSWLKRFIDNDTRYEQFLCPIPSTSLSISDYRGNCPHNG